MTAFDALLAAQALAGIVRAALMFGTKFRLRVRAIARTGRAFPGPGAMPRTLRDVAVLPVLRADRRRPGTAKLVLFALIAATSAIAPG